VITQDISAAEAKTHLSELLARVAHGQERFIIRKRGRPVAALVAVSDLAILDEDSDQEGDFLDALDQLPLVSPASLDQLIASIYRERDRNQLEAPPDLGSSA